MTVSVRDYWPWALFVIAIGVSLGAAVTRYFTVKRGRTRNLLDVLELREQIDAADMSFRFAPAPAARPNYSVRERLNSRLDEIETRLGRGDTKETKQALADLVLVRTYFHTAQEMLGEVERLSETADRVAALADEHDYVITGAGLSRSRRAASPGKQIRRQAPRRAVDGPGHAEKGSRRDPRTAESTRELTASCR